MKKSNGKQEEKIELPPGFRFHPTDEELITQYLSPKALDSSFNAIAIGEADLNKSEPWDLPWKAKMGEREWYFFCVRDRKYPTGTRTNRATDAGYWKATGKDKEVEREEILVGMKKTLVFYKGRAPKGEKTDWIMHEYRLEGKGSIPQTAQNEWVICRVFQKSTGGKKTPLSDMLYRYTQYTLPPLSEPGCQASHVPCFSGPAPEDDVKPTQNNMIINNNSFSTASSSTSLMFSEQNQQNMTMSFNDNDNNSFYAPNLEYPESIFAQDQSALRMLCEDSNKNISGHNINMNMNMPSVVSDLDMGPRSFEDPDEALTSGALVDLDSLWNY